MGARKKVVSAGDRDDGERPGDVSEVSDTPEMPGTPAMTGMARIGFAPIVRVDAPRREIELCATSETVDSHGTIFDYGASKDAFTRWIGNVREMHGRQAVGSRVAVRCDDETRRIHVRIRISRGAQDTWEKVLDGTLRGASIGASGVVWQRQRRRVAGEQRSLNVATRYDLVELSLVDNPSNPDALGVTFVREATPDVALLDPLDEPATGENEPGEQEQVVPADESAPVEANRARLHGAAQAVLTGCGCPVCAAARALLADVRLPIERGADVQTDDQPLARALAAGLADNAIQITALDAGVRALATTIEASLRQMAGEVGGLNRRVMALENQPLAGGPAARPVDKSSALTARGQMGTLTAREKYHALESLGGEVIDPQVQVAIAAELIRLQQRGDQ
jgi:hypothetical protein